MKNFAKAVGRILGYSAFAMFVGALAAPLVAFWVKYLNWVFQFIMDL